MDEVRTWLNWWWLAAGPILAGAVRFALGRARPRTRRGAATRLYAWIRKQARLEWENADLRDRNALLTVERDWWKAEALGTNRPAASGGGSPAGRASTATARRGNARPSGPASSARSAASGRRSADSKTS